MKFSSIDVFQRSLKMSSNAFLQRSFVMQTFTQGAVFTLTGILILKYTATANTLLKKKKYKKYANFPAGK